MEAKDIVQIIVSVVVPLMAVILAQQVITKREKSDRTMGLFYNLVSHVHEYAWAFYRATSHARLHQEWVVRHSSWEDRKKKEKESLLPDFEGKSLGEDWQRLATESKESGLAIRKAAAALQADSLLLTMIFRNDAKKLRTHIDELRQTADIVEHNEVPDFYTKCHPVEKELRAWTQRLLDEVSQFWKERVASYEGL